MSEQIDQEAKALYQEHKDLAMRQHQEEYVALKQKEALLNIKGKRILGEPTDEKYTDRIERWQRKVDTADKDAQMAADVVNLQVAKAKEFADENQAELYDAAKAEDAAREQEKAA